MKNIIHVGPGQWKSSLDHIADTKQSQLVENTNVNKDFAVIMPGYSREQNVVWDCNYYFLKPLFHCTIQETVPVPLPFSIWKTHE